MNKKNAGFKILVTIFSIGLTFSLINKFNVIEKVGKVEIVMSDDKQKSTPIPSTIPETPSDSTPISTDAATVQPTATPMIIMATPEATSGIDLEEIKSNQESGKIVVQIETNSKTKKNEANKSSNSTTEEPNDSKEDSDASNNSNDVENTEGASNVQYKVNVNSSGKLIMETDDEVSETDATVNISCDTETENEQTYLSYNYSELVNQESNYDNEPTRYITIAPGVYIVNFVNCDFNNVNFYLDTNTEETADEKEGSEPSHISADSYNKIPSQDIVDVEVVPNEPTKYISVVADKSFSPLIKFYSKSGNGIDANLRILDGEKNELQNFNLSQIEDSTTANFSFEEGKEYYLEINVSQDDDVNQETLCIQITDNEM